MAGLQFYFPNGGSLTVSAKTACDIYLIKSDTTNDLLVATDAGKAYTMTVNGEGTITARTDSEYEGGIFASSSSSNAWQIDGDCELTGSLDEFLGDYRKLEGHAFEYMFYNCTTLTKVAVTFNLDKSWSMTGSYQFRAMFYGCKNAEFGESSFILPSSTGLYAFSEVFRGCSAMTTAPIVDATEFGNASYGLRGLFMGCSSLTDISGLTLPSEINGDYALAYLFYECTSLTTPPELPYTSLPYSAYYFMFAYCTALTTAPALPAMTVPDYGYTGMFQSCTSLTTAPELPATDVGMYAYYDMFYNCTALTTPPPELPAVTGQAMMYTEMFYKCTALTYSPVIRLESVIYGECYHMFYGCSALDTVYLANYAPASAWDGKSAFTDWLRNVADTGTLYTTEEAMALIPQNSTSGLPTNWNMEVYSDVTPPTDALTVTFSAENATLTLPDSLPIPQVYSINGGSTWRDAPAGTVISMGSSTSLLIGANPDSAGAVVGGNGTDYRWVFSDAMTLAGNLTALLGQTSGGTYAFAYLFYNSPLLDSPDLVLPTAVSSYCFYRTFYGCKSLTIAPALPATTLSIECYRCMFQNCTGLTKIPDLPATALSSDCYYDMFSGCTALTEVEFPVAWTSYGSSCLACMFSSCSSLIKMTVPALIAPTASQANNWMSGVALYGDFYTPAPNDWELDSPSGIPETWTAHGETQEITLTKIWDDADNNDGKRPTSISVTMIDNNGNTYVETMEE